MSTSKAVSEPLLRNKCCVSRAEMVHLSLKPCPRQVTAGAGSTLLIVDSGPYLGDTSRLLSRNGYVSSEQVLLQLTSLLRFPIENDVPWMDPAGFLRHTAAIRCYPIKK